jgi:hypothetical protein
MSRGSESSQQPITIRIRRCSPYPYSLESKVAADYQFNNDVIGLSSLGKHQ